MKTIKIMISVTFLIVFIHSCGNKDNKKARFINGLVKKMTLDEKVGQMTQVDKRMLDSESDIAEYFLGSVEENPEGVTINYHVASRPTYHNGKVSTKNNEKVNKLAEEFVKNTHRRAETSTLNNGVMYQQRFKLQVLKKPNNNFIFCKILDKKCSDAFGKCLVGECLAVIFHNGTDARRDDIVYVDLNPYDHSPDPRWRNFCPRKTLTEAQFNEPIKKRDVHYWRLDL